MKNEAANSRRSRRKCRMSRNIKCLGCFDLPSGVDDRPSRRRPSPRGEDDEAWVRGRVYRLSLAKEAKTTGKNRSGCANLRTLS